MERGTGKKEYINGKNERKLLDIIIAYEQNVGRY